ncbi:MAG: hypothetical protein JKY67_18510 [Pseudomonadales bacterium]|nr:hypothetical protein [Pseudomonadales bacterium]
MKEFLVISTLGSDQPGIATALSRLVTKSNCNIDDSRMTVLGGEFAVLMLISGNIEHIKGLERDLPALAKKLNLTTITKRTNSRTLDSPERPYTVEVVALDNQGIIHEIASFFSEQGINIENMETETYAAPHTGSPMFSLAMTVNLPADIQILGLREHFLSFCDDRNLDSNIEPLK